MLLKGPNLKLVPSMYTEQHDIALEHVTQSV